MQFKVWAHCSRIFYVCVKIKYTYHNRNISPDRKETRDQLSKKKEAPKLSGSSAATQREKGAYIESTFVYNTMIRKKVSDTILSFRF